MNPFVKDYFRQKRAERPSLFEKKTQIINGGINLLGYINSNFGLAQTSRTFVESIKLANIPLNINELYLGNKSRYSYYETTKKHDFSVNILSLNPGKELNRLDSYIEGKYNIGIWFFELDKLPESWKHYSKYYDEIWATTNFLEEVLKRELPDKKIKRINHPLTKITKLDKEESKSYFELEDEFVCLFMFDFHSDIYRKNPLGVIETFQKTFTNGEKVKLIIKSHSGTESQIRIIDNKISGDGRIVHITHSMESNELNILRNACDVYISLHRSEGLGLTLLEAIALEKPTLCTNYSGNTDFCKPEWSELVDFEMVDIDKKSDYYKHYGMADKNVKWAEPKIDDAVIKLRKIYDNYSEYEQKSSIGSQWILENYGLDKISNEIKAHLNNEINNKVRLSFSSGKGYSIDYINNKLLQHFQKYCTRVISGSDVHIQHYLSDQKPPASKFKILIQPLDGTLVNQQRIKDINLFDLILTPSSNNKKQLINSGVTKPIEVVPNFYEKSESEFIKNNKIKSEKFTFYSESTMITRKNIENTLRYFIESFIGTNLVNSVKLILKISTSKEKEQRLYRIISEYSGKIPEISIINEFLDNNKLNEIWRSVDCYICLSYMEGFCIPALKAASCEIPVIALDSKISGYVDFLDDSNSVLLPCKTMPIIFDSESQLIHSNLSVWEEVDYHSYKKSLQNILTKKFTFSKSLDEFELKNVMSKYEKFNLKKIYEFNFGSFYLPKDDGCSHLLLNEYKDWEFYLDDLIFDMTDDSNCMDIGAHIGFITTKLSKKFKSGQIFSFEPESISFEFLKKNVELNNLTNVKLFKVAVGDESKQVGMTDDRNLFLKQINLSGNDVRMIKLDELEFPKIDLIKIDTEGFEIQVLNGARNLLKRDRPILIVEIFTEVIPQYFDFLHSIGYKKIKHIGEYNYLCSYEN